MGVVKVLLLDAPESMFDERRRLGVDGQDEIWDGVLHVVPPAGGPQQRLGTQLLLVLGPVAARGGLQPHYESGLFRTAEDYRVPDQLYCRRPEALSERGTEGAELVIEIRSPGAETYDKVAFYEKLGVREMLIVHPADRSVELLRAVDKRLLPVSNDAGGTIRSDVLGVGFTTVASRLRIDGTRAQPTSDLCEHSPEPPVERSVHSVPTSCDPLVSCHRRSAAVQVKSGAREDHPASVRASHVQSTPASV